MFIRVPTSQRKTKMLRFSYFVKEIIIFCLIMVFAVSPLYAQSGSPIVVRDTEIENILKEWSIPLLEQAKIPKDNLNLILVRSPQINAFVAGGANVFFYTGLLEETENPEEVLGVLAHEIGHIAGGHLIKNRDALERASYESILGTVLGIGAAIVSGRGEAANAIIGGSNSFAQRRYLAHSRVHESSADQAAFSYLAGANLNATGLESFFGKLASQELLPVSEQAEYVRTHPRVRDRMESIAVLLNKYPHTRTAKLPTHWYEQHKLMKAKLIGYINPGQVAWAYDDRDQSIPARYARAIAAYRQNETETALSQINALIKDRPKNPYFYELKGQMLADFSRLEESIASYQKALALLPDAPLIRIAYAHILIESGNRKDRLNTAISHLNRALEKERSSSRSHRLLAIAYGRSGRETLAKIHLAEEALLQRRLPYARAQAERALELSRPNSREWIKAKDILSYIENLERKS